MRTSISNGDQQIDLLSRIVLEIGKVKTLLVAADSHHLTHPRDFLDLSVTSAISVIECPFH
jgi:hypothetical protein